MKKMVLVVAGCVVVLIAMGIVIRMMSGNGSILTTKYTEHTEKDVIERANVSQASRLPGANESHRAGGDAVAGSLSVGGVFGWDWY